MSSRRKAPAPQRLQSLQHHDAALAERSQAARRKAKGTLASLDFDDDSEDEVQDSDEDFLMANPRRNGGMVSRPEAIRTAGGGGGGREEKERGEEEEESDEEDEDVVVIRAAGGANTPLGKRRPPRGRPSTGNKRRKRLFKEGRRIELDESDGEQDIEVPESFAPTLQVPLPDPSLKALLVRRQEYDVPEENICPVGSELAMWIYEASSSARRTLQVTLKEDVKALLLQKDAAEAFGMDSEGLDSVLWLFRQKPMLAYYEAQLCEGRSLKLSVYLTEDALRLASPDNVPPPSRAPLKRLRRLMEVLYPTQVPQPLEPGGKVVPFDAMQLYACLEEYKRSHAKGKGKARVGGTLPELRLTLRPYQQEALEWMVSREKGTAYFLEESDPADLPHGWLRLTDPEKVPLYFNPVNVGLSREAPAPWSSRGVSGGILADEMGLGKTIEVLSLVLTHRYEAPPAEDEEEEAEEEEEKEEVEEMDVDTETEGEGEGEQEERTEVMCPCGKASSRAAKWVQCSRCRTWVHLKCAGFASQAEADKAGRFVCEVCHGIRRHHAPRQVGATLIVCPQLILSQWEEELENHCHEGALRVAVYRGIKQIKTPEERRLLNPDHLGGFDVVLTTFDILNHELGHTDNVFVSDEGHDKLRRGKRYRVTPSPLACVVWWRICLDEAQMVETSTTGAAKMALRLHTKHRWCVSGTPISKGQLEDLYGLVLFLRAAPYDERSWWRNAIEQPYLRGEPEGVSRLHRLLNGLMWRTSKRSVIDQLALPPQTEVTRKLRFSKVEQHYYLKTAEACERTVVEALRRAKREGAKDLAASLHKCAAPLLRLRQACCHPQVGAGGIRGKRLMSMEEIQHKLLEECRIECEETQRLLLMDLCGLAAVVRIQAQVALMDGQQVNGERFLTEAGRVYERALLMAEENRVPVPIPTAALLEVTGNRNMASLPTSEGSTTICVEWGTEEQGQPSEEDPWWARVVFLTGKKVNGLRLRVAEGSRLRPRQCRLLASNSSEGYLFMEVASFDLLDLPLADPSQDEGEGQQGDRMLRGINMHEARVWKLEICGAEEAAPSTGGHSSSLPSLDSSMPPSALRLQLDMMTAEIDVDMIQILHISANFAEVLEQQAGGNKAITLGVSSSSSSAAAVTVEDPLTKEVEALTQYSQLQGRPLGHRVAWLRLQADAVKTRTASLCMQVHRLNRHLMERAETALASLKEDLKDTRAKHKGGSQSVTWWEWLLVQLDRHPTPSSDKLLARIRGDHSSHGIFAKAKGFQGLLLALKTRIDEVMDERKKLLKKIKALSEKPSDKEVAESGNCQRCRQDWKKQGPMCKNCHLSDEIEAYDKMLFTYTKQSLNHMAEEEEEDEAAQPARGRRDGFAALGGEEGDIRFHSAVLQVRAPSEAFRLLYTTLMNWLRLEAPKRKQDPLWGQMAEEAVAESKVHGLLGSERLAMQRMWNAHQDLLSLLDEAAAAATRLRLALPDEDPLTMTEEERKLVVFPGEALGRREEFYNQTVAYEATLKEKKHQLAFLKNMTQGNESESSEVGDCAVCLASMKGAPVMVLPCAHYFCETCVKRLLKGQRNKCPTCRKLFTRADVRKSHNVAKAARERREAEEREKARGGGRADEEEMDGEMDGEGKGKAADWDEEEEKKVEKEEEEEEVDVSGVAGSWGTKVSALVAEIQRLPCEDKCLVFSEWDEMLDVVEAALKANHVRSVRLKGERKAASTRAAFKHEADLRCLLLNLKTAAKGLTLVEANHVFLLEPVFNAATEAQAINRIHRIGQTRPTFVHRFVVRDTIEEKVEVMRRRSLAAAGGQDSVLSSVKKGRGKAEAEVTLDQYELLFSPKGGRRRAEEDGGGASAMGGRRIFDDEEDEEEEVEVEVQERPRARAVRRSSVRRVGGLSAEELALGQLAAGEGGRRRRSTARASAAQAEASGR